MKKALIIVPALAIAAIAAYFIFFRSSFSSQQNSAPASGEQADEQNQGKMPKIAGGPAVPAGDYIVIGTNDGNVQIKNFYKTAAGFIEDSEVIIRETPAYRFDYSRIDSSFTITVLSAPVSVARASAEKDFLDILGISQEDACKLPAQVIIPVSLDAALAGVSNLSFCGNVIK